MKLQMLYLNNKSNEERELKEKDIPVQTSEAS